MLSKPAVTAPIMGVTKPHQLDDPINAVANPLSAEEIALLEASYEAQAVIGALGPETAVPREVRASSIPRSPK